MKPTNPTPEVAAGFTLILEFADEGARQTVMIPIDREGNAISGELRRLDNKPLGQTQIDEELFVNGKRQRVIAVAKTLRMRLTFDE